MTKPIAKSLVVGLAALLAACSDSSIKKVAPGDIFVTELMPASAASEPQWLELYNSAKASINLQGCEITNTQGQAFTITDSLVMESQHYAVVANQDPVADFGYQPDVFEIPPAGGISLNCNGSLIDKMTYQIGPPTIAATARSWQLIPDTDSNQAQSAEANDKVENWCYTILIEDYMIGDRRFATPG